MQKTNLSWEETKERAQKVVQDIFLIHSSMDAMPWKIFGVPRGGIPAALIVSQILMGRNISTIMVQDSNTSDMVIDDIVDTGQTRNRFPNSDFYALVDKTTKQDKDIGWVVFPWEKMAGEDGPEENIIRILEYIGEDPKREGLKDTPKRIIKSYQKLYGGYAQNIKDFETTFESECDEMILLKGIEFYSTCEHHMLPFFGKAHIAYIPDKKIIGISKLARILEMFARRLQIQERLCFQVTEALEELIAPKGTACILEAQHFCMTSRGVEKQKSIMVTSSLTGVLRTDPRARNEFMSMIRE